MGRRCIRASQRWCSRARFLGVWINALVIPHHTRLLAADNPKTVVIIYLVQIPVYFLMLWLGIKYWGIVGAAAAWSLRVLLDTIMLLQGSRRVKAHTLRHGSILDSGCYGITGSAWNRSAITHALGCRIDPAWGSTLLRDKQHLTEAINAIWQLTETGEMMIQYIRKLLEVFSRFFKKQPSRILSERYPHYKIGCGTYGDLEVLSWAEGAILTIGSYTSVALG